MIRLSLRLFFLFVCTSALNAHGGWLDFWKGKQFLDGTRIQTKVLQSSIGGTPSSFICPNGFDLKRSDKSELTSFYTSKLTCSSKDGKTTIEAFATGHEYIGLISIRLHGVPSDCNDENLLQLTDLTKEDFVRAKAQFSEGMKTLIVESKGFYRTTISCKQTEAGVIVDHEAAMASMKTWLGGSAPNWLFAVGNLSVNLSAVDGDDKKRAKELALKVYHKDLAAAYPSSLVTEYRQRYKEDPVGLKIFDSIVAINTDLNRAEQFANLYLVKNSKGDEARGANCSNPKYQKLVDYGAMKKDEADAYCRAERVRDLAQSRFQKEAEDCHSQFQPDLNAIGKCLQAAQDVLSTGIENSKKLLINVEGK